MSWRLDRYRHDVTEASPDSPSADARAETDAELGAAASFSHVRRLLRRERTSEVLAAIAALAPELSEPSADSLQHWREIAPWTLAGLAREAIVQCRSNAISPFNEERFRTLLNAYSQSYDAHPNPRSAEARFNLLATHAYDQMPYQESDGQEISRTLSLFADEIPANQAKLSVINTSTVEELVGGPLPEALRAALLLTELAKQKRGVLTDQFWKEPWMADLADVVSRDVLREVVAQMSADVPAMRRAYQNELKRRAVPKHVRRYAYNPLASTPLVTVGRRFIVPQPRLIRRRMAPNALFYAGVAKYGGDFAADLGYLAETYVGRTLRQIAGARAFQEVEYRESGNTKLSTDWFLVMPNLVVLIESKATRPDLRLRVGDPELGTALSEQLSKSVKQLNATNALIEGGHPALAHIPTDRPRVGLTITAEPFYDGNHSDFRDLLPQPDLPTSFGSLRDLEQLAGYTASVLEDGLSRALTDSKLSSWSPLAAVKAATGIDPTLPTAVQGRVADRLGMEPPRGP